MKKIEVGDIVYVSHPDKEESKREHHNFFGKVIDVTEYGHETCVMVHFENRTEWAYWPEELSLAEEVKDMTLEEFQKKFGVCINATYI